MNWTFGNYFLFILFFISWWGLAFHNSFWKSPIPIPINSPPNELFHSIPSLKLSSLNRPLLTKALKGNYALMSKKIVDWNIDALLLEDKGVKNIRHFPSEKAIRAEYLSRIIKLKNSNPDHSKKFLPQTYASASFLLTLLPAEAIVALPGGIRNNTELYPFEMTSKIPYTFGKYDTEKIFLLKPNKAFVSGFYSDPVMIESLRQQGISLVFTPSIASLKDIYDSLRLIGKELDKQEEAELLGLFIESSLIAIENRLNASKSLDELKYLKNNCLYLNYNSHHFHTPSSITVTFSLLKNLGINYPINDIKKSHYYLTQEELLKLNPSYLILSASNYSIVEHLLEHYPALKTLKAIEDHHIFWVDENIQQSPTHHVVLAYFDIIHALIGMK